MGFTQQKFLLAILFLTVSMPVLPLNVAAEETMGSEELLFMEIPVVVTASKKEQPITEAPATIFVITAEDIRQSGANSIPDVLRMAPGVDVMTISARDQQVSIRGFNGPVTNKLLVLIDGRSVYWDGYGIVYWDLFPVGLQEIQRIEIVRSPGSVLYGANAYCGVINIITKTPSEIGGTKLAMAYGEYNARITSILHSGTGEKVDYKVSAETDMTDEWRTKDKKATDITRANALINYKITEKSNAGISFGRSNYKDKSLLAGETVGTGKSEGIFDYVQVDYNHSDIKFRTFMNSDDASLTWVRTGIEYPFLTTTYDAELQDSINVGEKNSVILGVNYRYNVVDKNIIIPENHTENLWALFIEDDVKFNDKIRMNLGGRYDGHPLTGEHFSPRGSVSFSPGNNQIIRLSASSAYRNPAYLDFYTYIENQLTTTMPIPVPPYSMDVPYIFIFEGNKNLNPEGITSYEIGYQSDLQKKVRFDLNMFYNDYFNFFTQTTNVNYYEANELFPSSPGGLIPKKVYVTYENDGSASGIGGEAGLDVFITHWLSGMFNYSYQQITDKEDNLSTLLINETNRVRYENPQTKVNAGVRMKFESGISVNLAANWVDTTTRIISDTAGNNYLAEVRAYTIVNSRMGYIFLDNSVEIALNVFNLLDDKHYEYPVGINLPDYSSDEIGRKITVSANYKF
ncbi:MAG: hypothetical protein A3J83_04730 [Elusimicrobia bacterium RIFOXYA2_FULL_40_6]|nr:MAG: hypothetical protein A3J83_04730 [Elusimicrobia bacterium RIFOXYA2_FULL_40_6]